MIRLGYTKRYVIIILIIMIIIIVVVVVIATVIFSIMSPLLHLICINTESFAAPKCCNILTSLLY